MSATFGDGCASRALSTTNAGRGSGCGASCSRSRTRGSRETAAPPWRGRLAEAAARDRRTRRTRPYLATWRAVREYHSLEWMMTFSSCSSARTRRSAPAGPVRAEGLSDGGDDAQGHRTGRGRDAGRIPEALAGPAHLRQSRRTVHVALHDRAKHLPVRGPCRVVPTSGVTRRHAGTRLAARGAARRGARPVRVDAAGDAAGGHHAVLPRGEERPGRRGTARPSRRDRQEPPAPRPRALGEAHLAGCAACAAFAARQRALDARLTRALSSRS